MQCVMITMYVVCNDCLPLDSKTVGQQYSKTVVQKAVFHGQLACAVFSRTGLGLGNEAMSCFPSNYLSLLLSSACMLCRAIPPPKSVQESIQLSQLTILLSYCTTVLLYYCYHLTVLFFFFLANKNSDIMFQMWIPVQVIKKGKTTNEVPRNNIYRVLLVSSWCVEVEAGI